MDFVIQWLWYLLAFVAGSAVARVVANIMNKRVDVDDVPAAPAGGGIGGER
ncbi:hypothetical protein [Mycobacterium terramassiliense]|uniref:Uncharacterized protein n=1 Tax=Mycobacterium terramassiliense TaxID=1841859 RepID=A0A2U3NH52_9MYCO|nr:hypothetical protein [Mycobacterium terramassiliense]SPM30861.1 hypothetical protein MXEN_18954 [Mycobacterium terramassiliense]